MDQRGCVRGVHDGLPFWRQGQHTSLSADRTCIVQQPISCITLMRGGEETFSPTVRFQTVPRFYLDVLDGDQVIQDLEGIDFADRDTALAEAVAGARDLVAHGIMQNEDVSGQAFLIRDNHGETVATVPFRDTLPGRLRGLSLADKPCLVFT